MVLRPVELDAATDPRPAEAHQRRLDDVVVVDEVTLLDLVICHLDAATQLRHHHHLDVIVLEEHHVPLVRRRFVGYRLDDGVRIHYAARTLIHSFL